MLPMQTQRAAFLSVTIFLIWCMPSRMYDVQLVHLHLKCLPMVHSWMFLSINSIRPSFSVALSFRHGSNCCKVHATHANSTRAVPGNQLNWQPGPARRVYECMHDEATYANSHLRNFHLRLARKKSVDLRPHSQKLIVSFNSCKKFRTFIHMLAQLTMILEGCSSRNFI